MSEHAGTGNGNDAKDDDEPKYTWEAHMNSYMQACPNCNFMFKVHVRAFTEPIGWWKKGKGKGKDEDNTGNKEAPDDASGGVGAGDAGGSAGSGDVKGNGKGPPAVGISDESETESSPEAEHRQAPRRRGRPKGSGKKAKQPRTN